MYSVLLALPTVSMNTLSIIKLFSACFSSLFVYPSESSFIHNRKADRVCGRQLMTHNDRLINKLMHSREGYFFLPECPTRGMSFLVLFVLLGLCAESPGKVLSQLLSFWNVLQFEMNIILGIFDPEKNTVLLRCEASPPSGGLVGGRINQQEKWISALHRQSSDNHKLHLSLFRKEEQSCQRTSQLLHKYTV